MDEELKEFYEDSEQTETVKDYYPEMEYTEEDVKNDPFANAELVYKEKPNKEKNDDEAPLVFGILGFALGIFSMLCFCFNFIDLLIAIVAIIFSTVSLKMNVSEKAFPIIGLILGGIMGIIQVVLFILDVSFNILTFLGMFI